jgi:hypothetical protein
MMKPNFGADIPLGKHAREQDVDYTVVSVDEKGKVSPDEGVHKLELREKMLYDQNTGKEGPTGYCERKGQCGANQSDHLPDEMRVSGKNIHGVEKRFFIDDKPARVYDPASKKAYDFVRVDASVKNGFVFTYLNEPAK